MAQCHCHTVCLFLLDSMRECDTVSLSYTMSLSVGFHEGMWHSVTVIHYVSVRFHERECGTVSLSYTMSLLDSMRECGTVSLSYTMSLSVRFHEGV